MVRYYDTTSPVVRRLWDERIRQEAVDLLSRPSVFFPDDPKLAPELARSLVTGMPIADLSDAMYGEGTGV